MKTKKKQFSDKDDSFILPNSPLKEKYITEVSEKSFHFKDIKLSPVTSKSEFDAKNPLNSIDSEESESEDAINSKKKTVAQMCYRYFKEILNENEPEYIPTMQSENSPAKKKEEDKIELEIDVIYEKIIENYKETENNHLYVAKRPIFDLLKIYYDEYPLLAFRKYLLYIK